MRNGFQKDLFEILKEKRKTGQIDRRAFLTGLAALGLVPAGLKPAFALNGELVLVNWGGDAVPAFEAAFTKSFAAKSGLSVTVDGSGASYGAMSTQAKSGSVTWDVCDADPGDTMGLAAEGVVEPTDYSVVDRSKIMAGYDYEYGAANYFFSYVIAYDHKRFGDNPPKSWADFWDVEKFPGKRTLYKWGVGNMEAALLADGVAPEDLYPLDQDRAIAKLEELKPHIVSYWDSGAESQQLMRDGEASMGLLWHTRANFVQQDTEGDVRWTYDQGLIAPSGWTVLKGNPAGKEAAMQFIAHCQDPARQIELLRTLGSGPANPEAHAMVPDDLAFLNCSSPENFPKQILMDMGWYAESYGESLDRFLAMIGE